MRDKADDSLAPPPPSALTIPVPAAAGVALGPDTSKFIMRKKPHTLPPLEKFRSLEGRGSPVPQARRRSSIEEQLLQDDGQVVSADGRPLIRLTKCTDESGGGSAVGQRLAPAGSAGPGAPAPAPQLSPIANRYTPLQPIRRGSEQAAPSNNNTP
ncbi:Bifunctional enzyme IspD/IspF [Frankliniella fusca]|uniref:Bifunctional enzyme IspD/IspF n=1 Tax=Frankliniella fusca TaxID=407009 RepID=A0AAE1GX32_9NEOP|nr:Bifunctional enzyme IspD/IspF [Frankliniella fusca]